MNPLDWLPAEPAMTRKSHHVEPRGALETARHYVRELIYGPTTASSRHSRSSPV